MMWILSLAGAAPAVSSHPDVADLFSGHLSVWDAEGPVDQGGAHGPDAVFLVGSVSKQFAAVATLTLVDAGRIDLQAPVARYFDAVPDDAWTLDGEACTVARLLRATCGLPRHVGVMGDETGVLDDPARGRAYLEALAEADLLFPPGSEHLYSNAGYNLVGLLVAEVGGAPYADVLSRQVLEPLGLPDTGIGPSSLARVYERVVPGTVYVGGWWPSSWLGFSPEVASSVGAAGGVHSTARDLARFTRALHSGELLSPSSYEAWTTVGHDDYAMGIIMDDDAVWHNGALSPHGYTSYLSWLPDKREVVVVLGQRDMVLPAVNATRLGGRVEEERLGKELKLDRLDTSGMQRVSASLLLFLRALAAPGACAAGLWLTFRGPRTWGVLSWVVTLWMLAAMVATFGSLRWGSSASVVSLFALLIAWSWGRFRHADAPLLVKGVSDVAGALFIVVVTAFLLWLNDGLAGWFVLPSLLIALATAQWGWSTWR